MDYLIVQISGRQYKVEAGKPLLVDFLGDIKNFECEQILAKSSAGKFEIGAPFLKEKVNFEVLGTEKSKIRVFKFHAKANTRKVTGSKKTLTRIKLVS